MIILLLKNNLSRAKLFFPSSIYMLIQGANLIVTMELNKKSIVAVNT